MRVHTFEHVGTEPFPNPISIDFSALPNIIALIGPLGSGKTTLLDLITAGLYLKMPYRAGAIYASFTQPGYVRLTISHLGKLYFSILTVSPKVRKVEAMLYNATSGEPIAGPNQADFLAATEKIFGDLALFLVTSYAAQYSIMASTRPVTFMGIPRTERRAVMATMLGLERYEQKKGVTDQRLLLIDKEIESAKIRRQMKLQPAAQVDLLAREHREAVTQIETATQAVEWARMSADEVQQRLRSQAGDAEMLSKIDVEYPKVQRRRQELAIREATLRQPIAVPVVEVDAQDIEAAEAAIVACEGDLADLDAKLDGVRVAETQLATSSGRTREIQGNLREVEILSKVPCGGEGAYATCPFLLRAAEIKRREPELTAELTTLHRTVDDLREQSARQQELVRQKEQLRKTRETHTNKIARARSAALEQERAKLREQARVEQLAGVTHDLLDCLGRVAILEQDRQTILDKMTQGLQEQAQAAATQLREAEAMKTEAIRQASALETRLRAAQEAAEQVKALDMALAQQQEDLEQWAIIGRGLGATGIPALRVDLALPAISEIATAMLRECFGEGRWEVAVVSQKEGTKTVLETLEVVVTRNGRRIDADRLSGGEGVIVNEAVSLALAMYRGTCQQSVWEPGLIMRDETSSSLGRAAPAYIDMFRNVMKQGGVKQVLMATHQPDIYERADARIEIANGTISIR